MKCPRCSAALITERIFAESDWIWVTRCLCGWYECPPENAEKSTINKLTYKVNEMAKKMKGAERVHEKIW